MEKNWKTKVIAFKVGEYDCIATALSLGDFESLRGGAFSYVSAVQIEEIILKCLIEPEELKEEIRRGCLLAGIPNQIYDNLLSMSGFNLGNDERNAYLEKSREEISTNIIESCKIVILASGVATADDIAKMNFFEVLHNVALAEEILKLKAYSEAAALGGNEPFQLKWERINPKEQAIMRQHQAKMPEVQQAIREQIGNMRPPRGSQKFVERG